VAQFDQNNVVYYVIQDANYDVVALLKSDGKPSIQYTYEPYGPLQLAESFAQQPVNRLGHQGLFFERFDAGPYDPALVPGARGLYHVRNRWYEPVTGRWTTRDPNETALPVISALAVNGTMLDVMLASVDLQGTYSDGMNLYQYERSNPVSGQDPLGLFWDDEIDEQISDWTGNRLYALGALNEGAKWAAVGLQTAIGIAKFFIPGSGLIDAFNAVEVLRSGRGGFWEALDIASAAFPIVHGAAKLAGLSSIFKARGWLSKAAHACNSFVAGTQVDTPDGPVPIECIIPGVRIVTRDQRAPGQQECAGVVTGVSKRLAPMVLWVTLATGQTVGMTPGHEVWTHQRGWTYGSHVQVGETLLTRSGKPVEIVDIRLDRTPTEAYDIQVDGTFTYFVDGLWVHNASCQLPLFHFHHALPKFLGGAENGIIHLLPPHLHRPYHGGLLTELAQNGLAIHPGQNWDRVLREADNAERAIEVLTRYTQRFDSEHGTSLLGSILDQLLRQ
jgi:hypothetical protein